HVPTPSDPDVAAGRTARGQAGDLVLQGSDVAAERRNLVREAGVGGSRVIVSQRRRAWRGIGVGMGCALAHTGADLVCALRAVGGVLEPEVFAPRDRTPSRAARGVGRLAWPAALQKEIVAIHASDLEGPVVERGRSFDIRNAHAIIARKSVAAGLDDRITIRIGAFG